jgi:rhamnose transport system permease protein
MKRENSAVSWKVFGRVREAGIAAVIVLLIIIFGALNPRFLNPENLGSIVLSVGILMILAVGQMLVIITRNIDLSVGSVLGLSAMVMGMVGRDFPQIPIVVLILVAMVIGGLAGAVNGILVAVAKVPAIIATLGTMAVFRGMIFLVSNNVQVDPQNIAAGMRGLAAYGPFGIPWLVVIALAVVLVAWWFTTRTLTGKRLYAIGSNPDAASMRGLNVQALTFWVFVAMGALAGLGGAMYVARFATVNPADAGLGFELLVISAVVIGGTNIFGGSGTVLGTVLGTMLVGILANGLTVVGVSGFWQRFASGAIILLAVVADSLVRKRIEARQSQETMVRAR